MNVDSILISMSRSLLRFFGLTSEYLEGVYEEFFLLKYHGGWSFFEAYNLPIGLRRWFLNRLIKEKQDETTAQEKASKQPRRR